MKLINKSVGITSIFLVAIIMGCASMQNTADQKRYRSNMDEMLVALKKAITDAGLNLTGSLNRDDGSILLTAVELTNMYGNSSERVQTMSLDIIVDKIDENTVTVEIEAPNRRQYVMAASNQTAESEFREKIFNSLEESIGSIKNE